MRVTTIRIRSRKEYFFTTDHCQMVGRTDEYTACTYSIPLRISPREGVEDGHVKNIEQLKEAFYYDMTEIPNPDPNYQPVFNQ